MEKQKREKEKEQKKQEKVVLSQKQIDYIRREMLVIQLQTVRIKRYTRKVNSILCGTPINEAELKYPGIKSLKDYYDQKKAYWEKKNKEDNEGDESEDKKGYKDGKEKK